MKIKIILMTFLSLQAFAHEPYQKDDQISEESWACQMTGNMKGVGIGFMYGGQILRGEGNLDCLSARGEKSSLPVKLSIYSVGTAYDLTYTKNLRVKSEKIFLSRSPEYLAGSYAVGETGGINLIKWGVDFMAAIRVSKGPDLHFDVGFTGRDAWGLGVRLQEMVFVIKPL